MEYEAGTNDSDVDSLKNSMYAGIIVGLREVVESSYAVKGAPLT